MNDATAKTRRLVKWLLWGFGSLLGLLVLAWVGFSVAGSRQLAGALVELKSAGYATSLEELAPPAVPDDQNGAADFTAAFALHPDPEGEDPALETARDTPFGDLSAEDQAAVLEILGKSGPLFEKIRSGRRRGGCRYTRDYPRGFAMDLPDVPGMMGASKLLRIRAQVEAAAGRTSEARESVRDILALSEAYRREPMLVMQLVRFASLAMAVDAVHLCVTADTSEADLRAWLEILPAPDSLDGAAELGLRGELALAASLAAGPVEGLGADAARTSSGWTAPWWKMSCARHLASMRLVIEISRKPYLEARPEMDSYVGRLQANWGPLDIVSALLFPATVRALDRQRIAQASLAVLRAGLSAEINRAVDLLDPLSGRPLVLRDGAFSSAGVPGEAPEEIEKDRLIWKLRKK